MRRANEPCLTWELFKLVTRGLPFTAEVFVVDSGEDDHGGEVGEAMGALPCTGFLEPTVTLEIKLHLRNEMIVASVVPARKGTGELRVNACSQVWRSIFVTSALGRQRQEH